MPAPKAKARRLSPLWLCVPVAAAGGLAATTGPAFAQATMRATAEAAFTIAVRDLRAAREGLPRAEPSRADAARAAEAARVEAEARAAARLAPLNAALAEARRALEAALALPRSSPAEQELEERRAALEQRRAEAEARGETLARDLDQAKQAASAAASRAAALREEVARAEQAMRDLAQEREALTRPGGARIPAEAMRLADAEERRLRGLEAEFTPAFQAAVRGLQTANGAAGAVPPVLARVREDLDRAASAEFCARGHERLKHYVRSALLAVETTRTARAGGMSAADAAAFGGLLLRVSNEGLAAFRAERCTAPEAVAAALAAGLTRRIGEAGERTTALRPGLAQAERAAGEAQARVVDLERGAATAREATAQATRQLEAATAELQRRSAELRAEAEPLAEARRLAITTATVRLEEALHARAAAVGERAAATDPAAEARAAQQAAAEAARRRVEQLEGQERAARETLAEVLAADYVQRHMRVSSRAGQPGPRGEPTFCAELVNQGPLAVRAVQFELQHVDRSQASGVAAPGSGRPPGVNTPTAEFVPAMFNQQRQRIDGLPPWRTWQQARGTCLALSGGATATSVASAAASGADGLIGYLMRSGDPAEWRLTIRSVDLARPATLQRDAAGSWAYPTESHQVVFEAEIRRVEQAALASPRQQVANAAAAR